MKRDKSVAKNLRLQRRDLVHAAGCTEPLCCVKRGTFDDYEVLNEALANGIRIPRSVARAWGMS